MRDFVKIQSEYLTEIGVVMLEKLENILKTFAESSLFNRISATVESKLNNSILRFNDDKRISSHDSIRGISIVMVPVPNKHTLLIIRTD